MNDFNPVLIREWWAGPLFDRARPWEWFQPPRIELEKNIFWDILGTFFHMKEIGIHFYIFLLFIFDLFRPKWGGGAYLPPIFFTLVINNKVEPNYSSHCIVQRYSPNTCLGHELIFWATVEQCGEHLKAFVQLSSSPFWASLIQSPVGWRQEQLQGKASAGLLLFPTTCRNILNRFLRHEYNLGDISLIRAGGACFRVLFSGTSVVSFWWGCEWVGTVLWTIKNRIFRELENLLWLTSSTP